MLRDRINDDLKTAMLAKDAVRTSVLRSLKSALTYAEVAAGNRDGLTDETVLEVFGKEAKKRQESADSYSKADMPERAEAELGEKRIIETYLPRELDEAEVAALVDAAIADLDEPSPKSMGQVIAAVKAGAEGRVDGATVARLAKERLRNA